MSPLRGRTKDPDEACAQAVDLARRAAEELAGAAGVGDYVTATSDGDRVVTHLFRCLDPAYQGWCWAVTVARASRAKQVTVSECLLLPGAEAILAPDWVPWRERLRPGDLGVGDILPAPPDDARLVPALTLDGDDGLTDWGETEWAMPGTVPVDVVPVPVEADGPAEGTGGPAAEGTGAPAAEGTGGPAAEGTGGPAAEGAAGADAGWEVTATTGNGAEVTATTDPGAEATAAADAGAEDVGSVATAPGAARSWLVSPSRPGIPSGRGPGTPYICSTMSRVYRARCRF